MFFDQKKHSKLEATVVSGANRFSQEVVVDVEIKHEENFNNMRIVLTKKKTTYN